MGMDAGISNKVQTILGEFCDVLPNELSKGLPPRCAVDHIIELLPRMRPLVKAPYQMLPKELEELQRQLQDLLDSRKVQPSKVLYGAPMLFQEKQDGTL